MGELVWLGDRLIPLADARVHPLDRGFLYGDGLFETMRSYGGVVHLLRRHLARLAEGGERIGLKVPPAEELRRAVRAVLQENGVPDARIRITLSRGVDPDGEPTLFIRRQPLLQKEEQDRSVGKGRWGEENPAEELDLLPVRRSLPEISPRLKSLNYLPEILVQDGLRKRGLREGILLTPDGYVAEGSVSNLFCLVRGELLTPPIELGILPGITRGRVIELARREGLPVAERPFFLDELLNADECFYTNSVREIVPVCSVAGTSVGTGTVGSVTSLLSRRYRGELPDEEL